MTSNAPNTEPIAIAAIWPPERPWCTFVPCLAAGAPVADEVPFPVDDGNSGGIEEVDGKVTPVHRLVTFDAAQQESVAFGELEAQ